MEFLPTINKNKCTGCGVCREVCPVDVFRITKAGRAIALKNKIRDCIGCKECVTECLSDAIRIGRTRRIK